MTIRIEPDGSLVAIYSDQVGFPLLGHCEVQRASEVEFDSTVQGWRIYLADGTQLPGHWAQRADAIAAEVAYLEERLQDGKLPVRTPRAGYQPVGKPRHPARLAH